MTYEQALEYIHAHKRFRGAPTLARMRELMHRLGDPQNTLRFVHVAGTNGKGSTTAMTASVLRRAGYKTGLYISPFVLCFRERMQCDGEMITEAALAECVTRLQPHAEALAAQGDAPTEFELVTAAAFLWFAQQGCEVVCLEVGLGGRFDATNVIAPPLVQVVTSISLDHVEILGNTLEEIAGEKCGIIKGGVTVCYPLQTVEALGVILEQCALRGSTLVQPNAAALVLRENTVFSTRFCYGELELAPSLHGDYQIYNSVTVVEICRALRAQGFGITEQDIAYGIAHTQFPARMELLCSRPLMLLDGAHNLSGAQALEKTLRQLAGQRVTVIMGMLADKDWEHSVACVAPYAARFLAVTPQNPRALPAEQLAAAAAKRCAAESCASIPQAVERAVENLEEQDALVVCGSLYLAAQARPLLLGCAAQRQKQTKSSQ